MILLLVAGGCAKVGMTVKRQGVVRAIGKLAQDGLVKAWPVDDDGNPKV